MIPKIHADRWEAFLDQHSDRKAVIDQAMWLAYRHGFSNPGQTYDEQQWAIMLIQMAIMDEAGWHHLDPPKIVLSSIDPALFRF